MDTPAAEITVGVKPNPHKGRSLLGAILLVFGPLILVGGYMASLPPGPSRADQIREHNHQIYLGYLWCLDNWKFGDGPCTFTPEPVPSD